MSLVSLPIHNVVNATKNYTKATSYMTCAGFGDLVFLPSGDMQLTRYSKKSAIVVKFSRARKRYERPGILSALQKAKTSNTPPT